MTHHTAETYPRPLGQNVPGPDTSSLSKLPRVSLRSRVQLLLCARGTGGALLEEPVPVIWSKSEDRDQQSRISPRL